MNSEVSGNFTVQYTAASVNLRGYYTPKGPDRIRNDLIPPLGRGSRDLEPGVGYSSRVESRV